MASGGEERAAPVARRDGRFDDLVRRATGFEPYDYQRRLADEGLPELLAVPTGCGKTQAVVLAWLYRRRFHPDPAVRAATPRRLVFVLPMRVLAEQTVALVRGWLAATGLDPDDHCHLLMGGELRTTTFREHPERDLVIVGTLDMVVSRMLNRGYGDSRFLWPVDFGLFSNDCQFVFDEVQLMGPALATSRQLHGLRARFGTMLPCRSTWMSATVDTRALTTVDAPTLPEPVELSASDRSGPLRRRLDAAKTVRQLGVDPAAKSYSRDLAARVGALHRPGTLTLVVLNTVERARQVHAALAASGQAPPDLVLLHSRFRPGDRRRQVERVLADVDPAGPGRVVVSTQVVEAGVDLSAATLVTEAAPWPSIVQRAGRCNRDGLTEGAVLAWARPPKPPPYRASDVEASVAELVALEGEEVTPASLRARDVAVEDDLVPVLRAKDLLELFDTAPDVWGNDLDVARFIRAVDDLDVELAWRPLAGGRPAADEALPGRSERCPVPVAEARALVGKATLWRFDHLDATWRQATVDDVRPGAAFLLDASAGGYRDDVGWDPTSKAVVEPVVEVVGAPDDRALDDDPATFGLPWVGLEQHLADVEGAAAALVDELGLAGSEPALAEAVRLAARYHDLGKAHDAFQAMLRSAESDGAPPAPEGLVAKSPRPRAGRNPRPHFRHELASVLALSGDAALVLDGVAEADLVRYLVGAHHGRLRVGCRAHPDEVVAAVAGRGARRVLGVEDGDHLPPVDLPTGPVPAARLGLDLLALGTSGAGASWTARALALRDREDLGVFRLGFLEALVRLADWRASAAPRGEA